MADEEARAVLRRRTDRALVELERFLGVPVRRRGILSAEKLEKANQMILSLIGGHLRGVLEAGLFLGH